MTDPILQAYREVEMAMERFTLVLHDHVDHLRKTEAPGSDKRIAWPTAPKPCATARRSIYPMPNMWLTGCRKAPISSRKISRAKESHIEALPKCTGPVRFYRTGPVVLTQLCVSA